MSRLLYGEVKRLVFRLFYGEGELMFRLLYGEGELMRVRGWCSGCCMGRVRLVFRLLYGEGKTLESRLSVVWRG